MSHTTIARRRRAGRSSCDRYLLERGGERGLRAGEYLVYRVSHQQHVHPGRVEQTRKRAS